MYWGKNMLVSLVIERVFWVDGWSRPGAAVIVCDLAIIRPNGAARPIIHQNSPLAAEPGMTPLATNRIWGRSLRGCPNFGKGSRTELCSIDSNQPGSILALWAPSAL